MKIKILNELNDFNLIYSDMQKQFPVYEMKSKEWFIGHLAGKKYKAALFFNDDCFVGYILFYVEGFLWIDYIAVLSAYQSKGYGTEMLRILFSKYSELKCAYFEVEVKDRAKPYTIKRQEFYEKLGCVNSGIEYYFPGDIEPLRMDLFYKPLSVLSCDKKKILDDIAVVFNSLHLKACSLAQVVKKLGIDYEGSV